MTTSPRNTKPLKGKSWIYRLATPRVMIFLAAGSFALLALALVGAAYLFKVGPFAQTAGPQLEPPPSLDDLVQEYPELASILSDQELDSVYKEFLVVYQRDGPDAALTLARKRGLLNANDELRMTLELDTTETAELQAGLEVHGIKVTAVSGNLMDIAIPLELLQAALEAGDPGSLFRDLTGLEHIVRIRLPMTNIKDQGRLVPLFPRSPAGLVPRVPLVPLFPRSPAGRSPAGRSSAGVETESLPRIGATAWQLAGYTGQGVKVGVLDVGFDGYKDLLGVELPTQVSAKSFIAGMEVDKTGEVHGVAVAEIIHDIAPDAELFFACSDTIVETQQAIDWLLSQGVQIISHSAGWVYGPKDGSSTIARAVDDVVDGGVLWVNSAGNYADSHYRGSFTDVDNDGYHEFGPGDEMMAIQMYKSPQKVRMILNWDDWQNGDQDYDLFIMDKDTNIVASSENIQNGPGSESLEYIIYEFSDKGPYYVVIFAKNATRPATFDLYIPDVTLEYYTPEYSLNTPGDARRSLTVGATYWSDDSLEEYSSQGPTDDGRMKPDISAPAGTKSAAYGGPFYGTSASTPHVSGAAALVLGAYPEYTPDQLMDFLKSRALDLGNSGPDSAFGYGRLSLGDPPLHEIAPGVAPTPPGATEAPTLVPSQPPTLAPTASPQALTTPTRRPLVTEGPQQTSGNSSAMWGVGLLLCVVLPGMAGIGGIGLLGGVWYYVRRQAPASPPARPGSLGARPARQRPGAPAQPPASWELPVANANKNDMACPRCGSSFRPEARFCSTCGLTLQAPDTPESRRFCINCGNEVRPGSKFCRHCGKQM